MNYKQQNIPFPLYHLSETDSTNTFLKNLCDRQKVGEFTTVFTDYQRQGRGQAGNSWESERDKNLMFSYVFYPNFCEAHHQFYLSQIVSLAVKDTLSEYAEGFSIKWPNDIYWYDKKISGILIENELYGNFIDRCMPGIGININQTQFVSDAPNPVSLAQITGRTHTPSDILIQVLLKTMDYYVIFRRNEKDYIVKRYFESLYRSNGYYPYADREGEFMARIVDVLPQGTLILCDQKGKQRAYNFKEVKYLGIARIE